VQRLAAALVADCHGLNRAHIGAICDALSAVGIDPAHWSARQLTAALDTDMHATGQRWPDHIENPGAFLAHRLRRLHLTANPPTAPTTTKTTNDGGCAADSPDKKQTVPEVGQATAPLTDQQHARINTARAQIDAILTRRRHTVGVGESTHRVHRAAAQTDTALHIND